MSRKLFLSFTGLIRLLDREEVSPEDLATGLFYFGCTREHVFNPGAGGEYNPLRNVRDEARRGLIHEVIKRAVLQAEAEEDSRATWRGYWENNSIGQLNELLKRCGYPPLSELHDYWYYWDVADKVTQECVGLIPVVDVS